MAIGLADQPLLTVLTLREAWRRARRLLRTGPLDRWRLAAISPGQLAALPPCLRQGDASEAEAIYAGRYLFAGESVEPGERSIFAVRAPSRAFARALEGFDWLRHHAAVGDELAGVNARSLVAEWLDHRGNRFSSSAYEPGVCARRILSWITHADLIMDAAGWRFQRRFMKSLAAQTRFLRSVADQASEGLPRLLVRTALAFADLVLTSARARPQHSAAQLGAELDRQIFADGGHVSRDPSASLAILPDLIALRETYRCLAQPAPKGLFPAIDRLIPAIEFFRHGDGSLALFNGAGLTDERLVARMASHGEARGEPIFHARQSGYHRIAAANTVVIADTGAPPPAGLSGAAHAGTLSFEMSCEASRIVVNCGRPVGEDPQWRRLSRSTAAHSTVTLADRSSSRFARSPGLDGFLGTPLVPGPSRVEAADPTGECLGFEASHDGYARRYGLLHRRRLTVSADGEVVEGFDVFEAPKRRADGAEVLSEAERLATARFHLHPGVHVENRGEAVQLTVRGQSWLFRASEQIGVEESIFFADARGPRRTMQLVLRFDPLSVDGLAWQFARSQ